VRGPKLNTVFEVQPQQRQVQGHDHCPTAAGHTVPDSKALEHHVLQKYTSD